jgi:hypothetical protein
MLQAGGKFRANGIKRMVDARCQRAHPSGSTEGNQFSPVDQAGATQSHEEACYLPNLINLFS